jgi:hypothetical protein
MVRKRFVWHLRVVKSMPIGRESADDYFDAYANCTDTIRIGEKRSRGICLFNVAVFALMRYW